jgi:mono/diheme cytochrome c family protein
MQPPVVARALVLALGAAGAAAPSATRELVFLRDGVEVKRLDAEALERRCGVRTVEIDDPYYEARKRFRACPLGEVLALGFGAPAATLRGRDVLLRALDGYAKPTTGERLTEEGGYLALGDLGRQPGAAPGWEPIGRAGVDPGPFYVVWAKPAQRDTHSYPWPYQLASIEVTDVGKLYPHTVPESAPPGASAWQGFAIFRGDCIACHAINGEGGRVGPDLNVPQSIVEYRPIEQVKRYIRDPRSFRYGNMPANPHLSDAQLDALIAYFETMKTLKHDPESSR